MKALLGTSDKRGKVTPHGDSSAAPQNDTCYNLIDKTIHLKLRKIVNIILKKGNYSPPCHFDEERGEIFAVQCSFKHQPRRFLGKKRLEMTCLSSYVLFKLETSTK